MDDKLIYRTIVICDYTAETFPDPEKLEYEFMVVTETDTVARKISIPTFLNMEYLCISGISLVEGAGGDMTLQEIYPICTNQDGYCNSQNVLGQTARITFFKEN